MCNELGPHELMQTATMSKNVVFVMLAESHDEAFIEMRNFVEKIQLAGLGRMSQTSAQLSGETEAFGWVLDRGDLAARIYDDPRLPGMYLSLTGADALMATAAELAVRTFDLATIDEAITAAERGMSEDPALLVMAALVIDKSNHARFTKLMKRAFKSNAIDQRRAAGEAAGVVATRAAKTLLKDAARCEKDAVLRRQFEALLELWH